MFLTPYLKKARTQAVLDVGCSTGNLLYHLSKRFPQHKYSGGDLSALQVKHNMESSHLRRINFFKMDVLKFKAAQKYDVILCNAVLYGFNSSLFQKALRRIYQALKPGGRFINFEFYHPWKQELEIVEKSSDFPKGHPLFFRPEKQVQKILTAAGFRRKQFYPFHIPIHLKKPISSDSSLRSYTVKAGKERKIFRGILFQPWCFLVAKR